MLAVNLILKLSIRTKGIRSNAIRSKAMTTEKNLHQFETSDGLRPPVNMKNLSYSHRCDDLYKAMREDLPFKICSTDAIARQFPHIFEYRSSNIDCYISSFLKYRTIGESETTALILDGDWLRIVDGCINTTITFNHYDKCSAIMKRPNATVQVRDAVVLKHEVYNRSSDLNKVFTELNNNFPIDAIKVFPSGCNSIIGVASCIDKIQLYLITYDTIKHTYSADLIREYIVQQLVGRVEFLVDLMKLCRWMASITGPQHYCHLLPDVRCSTKNHHHITWTAQGILKEFGREMGNTMEYLEIVYSHNMQHIEHGRVVNKVREVIDGILIKSQSVLITRIGNRLTNTILRTMNIDKFKVIADVKIAMEELHSIGFAHCDIKISNVFIDDNGIIFLSDLEYVTPLNDKPPHLNYLPYGITEKEVKSARRLDELQFQVFSDEVMRM